LSISKSLFLVAIVLAVTARAEAPATTQPSAYTESIPGTLVTFEMIPVSGAGPKPLWIGKTELTWDAFDVWAFQLDLSEKDKAAGVDAKSRPSKPYGAPDRGFGHRGYPAIGMTSTAAQAYCDWLSKKTGKKYRLPTVQEWQLACRAAEAKPDAELKRVAWFWDNADGKTHPVGKLQSNPIGLHDMLGNVAEWAMTANGDSVVCGGSYNDDPDDVRPNATKPMSKSWQATDPQSPKSRWWLSDAPFVGMRLVCEP
jgi:formylglycine-generating enzyme required for sulfatase activity